MRNKLIAVVVGAGLGLASALVLADDKTPAQPADQAQMKADRDAKKAAEANMTPEQKAAHKKHKRAHKQKEMTSIEKAGNPSTGTEDAAAMKKNYDATKNDPKALPSKEAKQKALTEQEKKSSGQ
jgi:hypothetical protein